MGSISKLWRYPVKSMLGEACERLELDARGARGDRLFAVLDAEGRLGSGKSSGRLRYIEGLFTFRAAQDHIAFPDGARMTITDPGIHDALSRALGLPVRLARECRSPVELVVGCFAGRRSARGDQFPYHRFIQLVPEY